ncbi:hypothetical protein ABBQ32_011566 [Trebouxia sp. C0010 RCD-2024]
MAHTGVAHYGLPHHQHDCVRQAHSAWHGPRRHVPGRAAQPCWAEMQARSVRCCAGANSGSSPRSTLQHNRFKYVINCSNTFSARVPFKGMTVHVGRYETAEDAAKAVDIARVFLNKEPINFVADAYDSAHIRASASSLNGLIAGMRELITGHRLRKAERKPPKTSRFKYVYGRKNGTYSAKISSCKESRSLYLGQFPTEEEAAKAVDVTRVFLNKEPVNYWAEDYDVAQIKASATNTDELIAGLRNKASQSAHHKRFRYVRQLNSGTYTARIRHEDGTSVYLGVYQTAQEAAKAVDVARVFLNREPINFGAEEYDSEHIRASAATLDELIAGMTTFSRKPKTSRYCHVVKRSKGFRAYVLVDQKQVHLGFYPVEEDAARATDTARLYLDLGAVNFPQEQYDVEGIKASSSTFDELVCTLRQQARKANAGAWSHELQEQNGVWSACLQRNRTKVDLGLHYSRDAAAKALDRGLIFLGDEPRTFPDSNYDAPAIRASAADIKRFAAQERRKADATHKKHRLGKFGSVRRNGSKFAVVVRREHKQQHLGSFVTKADALRALDKFSIYTGSDAVYFPAAQYDKQAIRSSAATVEEFILQTRLRLKRLKQKDEAGP